MKFQFPRLFRKYRDLLLAIALFLVIDLGVLVFNFQSSRLLEADTGRINLASDMRVFSQQLAKSILTLKQESLDGALTQTSVAQIRESYTAHNQALFALRADLNLQRREFLDDLVRIEEARTLLLDLDRVWTPLAETIKPLMVQGIEPAQVDIDIAANRVVARNLKLMQQAEDLTRHLESMAIHRAGQMRLIQLAAIFLALLNFVFIVFKFLRTLAKSDHSATEARKETDRILETVREGLFLLDCNGLVGSQQSRSTAALLGQRFSPGESFFACLYKRMGADGVQAAENFISVLFNERVKPALLKQLNPLREVRFEMPDGKCRYLDFEFQQVLLAGRVEQLLVSVSDITEKVVLAQELAGAQAKARSDVEALLALLEQEPVIVSGFLEETNARLLNINRALQDVEPTNQAYRQLIDRIASTVHGIKGEAGALNLLAIETAAHSFEGTLSTLRKQKNISGDGMISIAVAMNDLLEELEKVKRIITRLMSFSNPDQLSDMTSLTEVLIQIEQFTLRIANDLSKKVRFETSLSGTSLPRKLIDGLRELLPQLVRNAVAHGIEPLEERLRSGKPEEGLIRFSLETGASGELTIALEDDGCGLDPDVLRQSVLDKGIRPPEEVATMSDQDAVAMIFSPGFSTLGEVGIHAGRGDGLSVVKTLAERLGARLQISSRPHKFTRFSFVFQGN